MTQGRSEAGLKLETWLKLFSCRCWRSQRTDENRAMGMLDKQAIGDYKACLWI